MNIYVELAGGYGNQLFQYAFGNFVKNTILQSFDINKCYDSTDYMKYNVNLIFLTNMLNQANIKRELKLHNIISDPEEIQSADIIIEEKTIKYDEDIEKQVKSINLNTDYNKNVFIKGYWQSSEYFDYFSISKNYIEYNTSLVNLYLKLFEKLNAHTVSVHVRRKDYLTDPILYALDKSYYEKAMSYFFGNVKFIFFSDDMDWCKNVFPGHIYIENTSDKEDLFLMSKCDSHIIANSSFSWWASYLGEGFTIAPKQWFRDNRDNDIVPENWVKI